MGGGIWMGRCHMLVEAAGLEGWETGYVVHGGGIGHGDEKGLEKI